MTYDEAFNLATDICTNVALHGGHPGGYAASLMNIGGQQGWGVVLRLGSSLQAYASRAVWDEEQFDTYGTPIPWRPLES